MKFQCNLYFPTTMSLTNQMNYKHLIFWSCGLRCMLLMYCICVMQHPCLQNSITSSSPGWTELSVQIQSFSAVKGTVSFILDARNIHVAPNSCSLVFLVVSTDKNLSKQFIASGKTSSSHFCSSQTWKVRKAHRGCCQLLQENSPIHVIY